MRDLEENLDRLLIEEGLVEESIYLREYEDFEEFPIYSRFDQLDFLKGYSFNEKNKILIGKILRFIEKLEGKIRKEDRLLGITIVDWDDYSEVDVLTPNIFVSSRKKWILDRLKLRYGSSVEENLIKEYLVAMGVEGYGVYRSNFDGPCERVYIVKENSGE